MGEGGSIFIKMKRVFLCFWSEALWTKFRLFGKNRPPGRRPIAFPTTWEARRCKKRFSPRHPEAEAPFQTGASPTDSWATRRGAAAKMERHGFFATICNTWRDTWRPRRHRAGRRPAFRICKCGALACTPRAARPHRMRRAPRRCNPRRPNMRNCCLNSIWAK